MKRIVTLSVIGALFAGGLANGLAQTTNVYLRTYFVLTGLKQGGTSNAVPVRIIDKDILVALNGTSNFNFSAKAQLLLSSTNDEVPIVLVRDVSGGQTNTTDVSNFITVSQPQVVTGQNGASYAIRIFNFDDQRGTSFTLTGFTTMYSGRIQGFKFGALNRVFNAGSEVVGPGTVGGSTAVLHGNVYAGFPTAEVH